MIPTPLEGPEWVVRILLVLSQAAIFGESPVTVGGAWKWLFVRGCRGGGHYPDLETLTAHGVVNESIREIYKRCLSSK